MIEMSELLSKINQEERKIYEEYLIREPYYHWSNNKDFTATTYYFWNEYRHKHDYQDWQEHSFISYLSYLNSKRKNLFLKMNKEKLKLLSNN